MPRTETLYTTCTRDCPSTCGLEATVTDGRLVRLAGSRHHPLTRSAACVKAQRYVDRVYSPERVLHPMIREDRKAEWRRTSWDEALDRIAQTMRRIRDESGPEAILYYQGYGERTALKLLNSYFFHLFGGVTTLRGSLCGGTGQASQNLDMGERISHDPLDHANSRAMVLWARNPASTNVSLLPIIKDLKKRGGLVVTIDPFRNRSASLAHRHIAPAPNRDAFLAMAAAKLILARSNEDRRFLSEKCNGATQYMAFLDTFTVDRLCAMASVSMEDAVYLADLMGEHRPTATLLGWGLHRHVNAHLTIRAIDALAAISGNIGVAGGGVSQGFEEYGPYDQQYWGAHLNPDSRTLLMPRIGEEIIAADNPPIRMIFSSASNPVCMAPNTAAVTKAFNRAEFVVYNGHFLDDTADCAHVFLPATTFLEEEDVMATYGHNYVGPVNRAIEPLGECLSNFDMFQRLAKRFPFADRYCGEAAAWLDAICAPIRDQGCSMEALKTGPFRLDAPMAPYTDGVFPTASGRFEFMPPFSPEDLGQGDPGYPYRLLSVAPHHFICSERTLADHEDLPPVWLHPAEAKAHGVKDGNAVIVQSPVGRITARLHESEDVRRDCLVCHRGGWLKAGHGVNRLTLDTVSAVGEGAPYYETCVTIKPIEDSP